MLVVLVAAAVGITGIAVADDDSGGPAPVPVTIDFETGFVDKQLVGAVSAGGNVVTFSVGTSPATATTAFIAQTGRPSSAFFGPGLVRDAPVNGNFFLSDDREPPASAFRRFDYFIDFASPVGNLSLVAYDLERGPGTLNVYSDAGRTLFVGSVTVPAGGDGAIQTLSVPNPTAPILAASFIHASSGGVKDSGVGIDDVTFTPLAVDGDPDDSSDSDDSSGSNDSSDSDDSSD